MDAHTEPDLGPKRVAVRAKVAAPADELWALLANPHRHHEIDGSGTVRPEVIGPRELQTGDRFRVRMKMFGVPYAITSRVVESQPGRAVEWEHPGKHSWRWEFAPLDDGTTEVTEIFDYTASRIGRILERTAADRNRRAMHGSLKRLQARYAG